MYDFMKNVELVLIFVIQGLSGDDLGIEHRYCLIEQLIFYKSFDVV